MRYFEMFPLLDYDGITCVDVTRRVVVRDSILGDPKAYAPYEIPAGERADQVAAGYYGKSEREWIVYMSTGVIDPYFDWYLGDQDFAAFVLEKYGSLEEAVERVHHWEVAWYDDSTEISVQGYESLADDLKQYYEPLFGVGSQVLSYVRREDDVRCTTNMVVTLEVGEHSFEEGERLQLYDGPTFDGNAELAWANATHVKVIHVQGTTEPGANVVGVSSGENLTIVSREYTSNVIPVDARPFWTAVSCLDYERDKNEARKNVRLLDSGYVDSIELETRGLLRANT